MRKRLCILLSLCLLLQPAFPAAADSGYTVTMAEDVTAAKRDRGKDYGGEGNTGGFSLHGGRERFRES